MRLYFSDTAGDVEFSGRLVSLPASHRVYFILFSWRHIGWIEVTLNTDGGYVDVDPHIFHTVSQIVVASTT